MAAVAFDVHNLRALRQVLTVALVTLRADLAKAQAKSTRAMGVRGRLPAGSTRARVTTANARWMAAAEERDRIKEMYEMAEHLISQLPGQGGE